MAGRFFLRMEFTLGAEAPAVPDLSDQFGAEIAERFGMRFHFSDVAEPKRIVVLVSRYEHCLLDLLWRGRRGELGGGEIVSVISNHEDLRADVEAFGIPYHHVAVEKGRKPEAEEAILKLLAEAAPDVAVLARYMQILSPEFLAKAPVPIINIHHSFLPAFVGADPYGQAKKRGVKLIGATAHYVTEELDAGPIIEQGTNRVSHRDDVESLTRVGADIERLVLARAVRWHCEDRVVRDGNRTVVF